MNTNDLKQIPIDLHVVQNYTFDFVVAHGDILLYSDDVDQD